MSREEIGARFDQVAALLPGELRRSAERLSLDAKCRAEELRLRSGRPLYVSYPKGEVPLKGTLVTADTLSTVLEIASGCSVHTVMEQVRNGFIPVKGGHRLGLCGTGVVRDGALVNLRTISSIALRVAREYPGIAAPLLPKLHDRGGFISTLILSPPGGGKTTLLRDVIRCISAGEGCTAQRIGLADERSEVAAMAKGVPTLDVGPRCDVMDGCPKSIGLTTLLRGMAPQVLAVDEITVPEDVSAILQAVGCGVSLLATAHGSSFADLKRRPLYRQLMTEKVFDRIVVISLQGEKRRYDVTDGEGKPC